MQLSELGAFLQRQRGESGLSLEDVETRTHIRRKYLEALEAGDWDNLPPGVYTRGLLKNYARAVGISQNTVIRMYVKERASEAKLPEPRLISRPLVETPRVSAEMILGVGLLVVALSLFAWTVYTRLIPSLTNGTADITPTAVAQVAAGTGTRPAGTATATSRRTPGRTTSAVREPAVDGATVGPLATDTPAGTAGPDVTPATAATSGTASAVPSTPGTAGTPDARGTAPATGTSGAPTAPLVMEVVATSDAWLSVRVDQDQDVRGLPARRGSEALGGQRAGSPAHRQRGRHRGHPQRPAAGSIGPPGRGGGAGMAPPGERRYRTVQLADLASRSRPPVVAVAMSGGVDSSVAAALCVAAGLPTLGVMLRLWAEPGATGANKCCTLGAIDDARAVAECLGISFHVLDAVAPFHASVVAPFLTAAEVGDTPNPCFGCNRQVRFGFLLRQVQALGADYLATGHYARVAALPGGAAGLLPDGAFGLLRGVDEAKDQSYMLHRLGQEQLARALFPVGDLTKAAVRDLARQHGLPNAVRPDSMDLCWVGPDGLAGFLGRGLPAAAMAPGPVLGPDGRELGRHEGLPRYTLGQRRGLGIAAGEPLYVTGKDAGRNALWVGPATDLAVAVVRAADWHWIAGQSSREPVPVVAQIRYRAPASRGHPDGR